MEAKDVPFLAKLADNVLLSGGAYGADLEWGKVAEKYGHQVVHWSFDGHNTADPNNTYLLNEQELKEADKYVAEAAMTLSRPIPKKQYIKNLIRRSWYQVCYVDNVWVVGNLTDDAWIYCSRDGRPKPIDWMQTPREDRLGVAGGTAWACQMYMDRFRREHGNGNFNLWLYDQHERQLYSFSLNLGCWLPYTDVINRPFGIYAAIGTRKLNDYGRVFIQELFNR